MSEQVEREVEEIRKNALSCGREITFTQAEAIRGRSIELQKEGRVQKIFATREKKKQINECWRIRKIEKRNT